MKVATFNVNSVRARLPVVLQWLESAQPDVACFQELKCVNEQFPRAEIEALGYHVALHGQKTYNGVAILSRTPIEEVERGMVSEAFNIDARVIRGVVGGVQFVNTYVPNGTKVGSDKWAYKLGWLDEFREALNHWAGDGPTLWLGDINIAPDDRDVYEAEDKRGSVGFHPDEHVRLTGIVDSGWTEMFRRFTEEGGHYSFWEYMIPNGFKRNLGWRIDHCYANPSLVDRVSRCWIETEPRTWERPSDHTPVWVEIQ